MSCASGGAGSPGHLTNELFRGIAGIEMTRVPYKGPALAVSYAGRSSLLPDVPTVAEAGYAGFDASFSMVLYAPKGMPRPIVEPMTRALGEALRQPDVMARLRRSDQSVVADTPEASAARLAVDFKTWGAVVRRTGLRAE